MSIKNFTLPDDTLHRLLVPIIAGTIFALFMMSGLAPALSGQALDFLFMLRGPAKPNQEIIIIGIDEDSLEQLGTWPFQRKLHAELLSKLGKAQVIGFDILFSEPTSQDETLSHAFAAAPPVILGVAHDFRSRIQEPSPTLRHYRAKGLIETVLDNQGVVRRINPVYLNKHSDLVLLARVMADFATPLPQTDFEGKHTFINFYGPEGTFLYLSYSDVLAGVYSEQFFQNRFILIGAAALGLGDSHVTPFSLSYPMPGVEIQATVLSNILDNNLLVEVIIFPWLGLMGVVLLSLFIWPKMNVQWNILINMAFTVLTAGCSILFFHRSLYLDPSKPIVFLLIIFLVYLISERIRTANVIFSEVARIDEQLQEQMQNLYANVPPHFFLQSSLPSRTGTRLDLFHLQAGIKTLSLQHLFIEKLLREDLPPLILWDSGSELVILANSMFKELWQRVSPDDSDLPTLGSFYTILRKQQTQADNPVIKDDLIQETVADVCLEAAGRKKYFRVQLHGITAGDVEFNGMLAILTDITEIKELELLKDEILSIVSHELKLPLTVMLGYGEMLSENLKGHEKQQIDKILAQTVRMKKLIEHFLDIARLEHGRRNILKLPFDPLHLVREAVQAISSVAEKKSIDLITDVPSCATVLIGDFSLLNQSLINLLDNAVKFSPRNTRITLQLTEEEQQIIFCVIDQGPGIPADMQQAVFEKFNRGNKDHKQEGFGLGLCFVREVIHQHGGELYLDPHIHEGASFCFSLPKHDISAEDPQQISST